MLSVIRPLLGQIANGPISMGIRALLRPSVFGASALLIDAEGRIGLVRHSYTVGWSIPGGGVNRGEAPIDAVMREMHEELGDLRCDPPELFGLYVRRSGWATNVIALYRLMNAKVDFRPCFEVRDLVFVDPANPPAGTLPGTRRRLAEWVRKAPPSRYW